MKPDDMESRIEKKEEEFFFAPLEEIMNIEKIIFNLEAIRQELRKVAEAMLPVEN